ncbi:MAG: YifB family Mg chelatase-like AAA ATPase [Actinobacteria bacterium]|nr:YifB family Mg chelatase-like AAA ATPase [Actinomycetota bacterium]
MAYVHGFAVFGTEAQPVRVEAHVRPGLPGMVIVGLPGAAVREARERVRSGAASSGLPLPSQRITVNLSPGEIRKEGPGFDLPMALAVLAASGYLPVEALQRTGAVGEVALDGLVRPVRGVLAVGEAARRLGVDHLVLPLGALPEAQEVGGVELVGVRTLAEAVAAGRDAGYRSRLQERGRRWLARRRARPAVEAAEVDLADVAGHDHAKRALEIAAAGGHHVLMVGSPGSGKTMLARRMPTILPPLEREEALEVTRVWSVAGLHPPEAGLVAYRPFRAPHHTVSRSGLVGGGPVPRPGEVSLAHRGVLFLDEMSEFARDVLESLRQPLEEGRVTISRRSGTCVFPAACTLVAALNPCPCGYWGHPERECRCSGEALARHRAHLSGPVVDRIDVVVEIPPLTAAMLDAGEGPTSAVVQARVMAARAFRALREAAWDEGHGNGSGSFLPALRTTGSLFSELEARFAVTQEARGMLRDALVRYSLGGRGYARVLAVSRTLADLDGTVAVRAEHVAEALALRVAPAGGLRS